MSREFVWHALSLQRAWALPVETLFHALRKASGPATQGTVGAENEPCEACDSSPSEQESSPRTSVRSTTPNLWAAPQKLASRDSRGCRRSWWTLNVQGSQITGDGVRRLTIALPGCRIFGSGVAGVSPVSAHGMCLLLFNVSGTALVAGSVFGNTTPFTGG